ELQRDYLSAEQIAASRGVMGLDRQLVADRTYYLVEDAGAIAGCGGWSRRATLYGSDQATDLRAPRLLDPATESARIRAMYTHPDHARRGIGRMVLATCEGAARGEGFTRVELMATLAGVPLYRACGYQPIVEVIDRSQGVPVPLVRMGKALA
ncbi:MAG: GNAT family N-acetyltransferase, partial [Sphingomonas sp.]